MNGLAGIALTKNGKTLTFVRNGEQWSIKERAGYPVEGDKVRALLVQLTNAELAEPKTASKDRWALLDLEDPATAEAKSSLVRLLDAGGKPIAELVIGKQRMNAFGTGRHGIYVRRPNETQTWLASGEPKLALDVKDWVDRAIFKADTEKLKRVIVAHPAEAPIVVEREGEAGKGGKFVLKSVPEGMKVKENAGVEQIALSLGSVELDDVRKLDATPVGDNVSTITAESSDGVTVTLRLRREGKGDEAWLSFTAAGEGEAKKTADAMEQLANATRSAIKVQGDYLDSTKANADALVGAADVVLDGTDNLVTRRLVAAACDRLGKPLVSGAVSMFSGQVTVFAPHLGGPPHSALYPDEASDDALPSCEANGILGPVTGVIGTLMAMEAIKLVTGVGEPLVGRLLVYDAREARFSEIGY